VQKLDRDALIKLQMTGGDDDPHASCTENAVDAVLTREDISLANADPKVIASMHPRASSR
jgi:hypothetical protein